MDKKTFKLSFIKLLEEGVEDLTTDQKMKYMKKWLNDFSNKQPPKVSQINNFQENGTVELAIDSTEKIGIIVRSTIRKLVRENRFTHEHIKLLQDESYCKYTFDINYPFLKLVEKNRSLTEQRKINGYDRYWKDTVTINHERYLICNDWYERNKSKYIRWVNHFVEKR